MADEEPPPANDEAEASAPAPDPDPVPESTNTAVIGSAAMRPVFLGNLLTNYDAGVVSEIFHRPIAPPGAEAGKYRPVPVDRVDLKRGYCFVFLKDAQSQEDKEMAEAFVTEINGMEVPKVTTALRAEFARGDGRVKRKEENRRRNISPSETLFVVNFHEENTKQEDLEMLFEPFGQLVRIDMKRNYAFVQFKTIPEATKAKEATNGGKFNQSVLTVEYVARQREERPFRGGRRHDDDRGGGRRSRDDDRRGGYDRRGGDRSRGGPPPDRFDRRPARDSGGGDRYSRDGGDRDRYSRDGGGRDRHEDSRRDDMRGRDFDYMRGRGRDRSPPGGYRGGSPGRYRGASPGGRRGDRGSSPGGYRGNSPGGYRGGGSPPPRLRGGRSRSRSRSPPRGYRSRSPPRQRYVERERGGSRYDDYDRGEASRPPIHSSDTRGPGGDWSPPPQDEQYRGEPRGRSPDPPPYRGRDERGYRP